MRTSWILAVAAGTLVAAAGAFVWRRPVEQPASAPVSHSGIAASQEPAPSAPSAATLYCEFTNFADQNPRVGFYFAVDRPQASYGLIFQRERDGEQVDYGQDERARPQWALNATDNPSVLKSPDGSIAINLYNFDPGKAGTTWFEAGLRSIRYLNLGGRCRLSST